MVLEPLQVFKLMAGGGLGGLHDHTRHGDVRGFREDSVVSVHARNEYNQHQRALTMPLSKKNALTRGSMLRTLALECFSAGCA